VESLKARVDRVLEDFVTTEIAELLAVHTDLKPVAERLRLAVADGKRLRAGFCYWGWRAAGQPDCEEMVRAAAALELVHAAAIVHDDIIDASATRRGIATAHVALREPVGEGSGAEQRAVALAILVGDLLVSWAGQLFVSCGLPGAYLARARPLWATLARELVAGECLEILSVGDVPRVARSLEIIRFKTAKYTVERPLQIGATLGGARNGLMSAFTAYGVPLGEAFQLRDDLLGVFGEPSQTGKSNLDDLNGHKPTALLAITLELATGTDRRELERLLARSDLGGADLRTVREIMRRIGALDHIEAMIRERATRALQAVERAPLRPDAAAALAGLVPAMVVRAS
jgi:geranylgeranyl diphosphate synthase type I